MVVVSLSIPDELLELLDAIAKSGRQATRSEVVRQAISVHGGDVDRIRAIIKSISDRANLILDEPDRAKRYFKIFPRR